MAINLQRGKVEYVENSWMPYSEEAGDEFIGHCLVQKGGSGPATVLPLAINGGAARIAITAQEDDVGTIYGPLAFEPDECTLATLYVRLRITDVSVASVFIGFTDAVTDTVVLEDEDGTLNTVATDACGILLEGEQDETWQTVGVQNDTDNSQTAIGAGTGDITLPDATDNNWHTWVIELTSADSGTMKVYGEDANGNLVLAATRTSFFRSSIVYAPVISADARNSAYNVDVAEFGWTGGVGSTFD